MQSRLGPAIEKASAPPPTRVEWLNQVGGMPATDGCATDGLAL